MSMTSASGSTSIHSWSMPSPYGPSRSSVGGTSRHSRASDTRYAATSRRVSVPIGKSNSGRSPTVGFQTASRSDSSSGPPNADGCVPCGQTRTTIALFVDPTRPPRTSSSPSRSATRAGSCSVEIVAVLPRADVAGGVERVAAQRARRAAGADHPERALHEGARRAGAEPHPEQVRAVLVLVVDVGDLIGLGRVVRVALRARLDQDPLV